MALAMSGDASLTEKYWAELSQDAPWKKIIHSSAQQLTQEKEHERETPRLAHIGARHVERSEAFRSKQTSANFDWCIAEERADMA